MIWGQMYGNGPESLIPESLMPKSLMPEFPIIAASRQRWAVPGGMANARCRQITVQQSRLIWQLFISALDVSAMPADNIMKAGNIIKSADDL